MAKYIVRISDGLGNQMFQYAFAYALAMETSQKVFIDPLFWKTSLRDYQLNNYNISMPRFIPPVFDSFLGMLSKDNLQYRTNFRNRIINKKYNLYREKQIMAYDPSVFNMNGGVFFEGFWQNHLYFDKYKEKIKKELARKTKISDRANEYTNEIKSCCSVSIHVRRTDYVRTEDNVAIKTEFYMRAYRDLVNRIGKNLSLYVFTDDKKYVRDNFNIKDYTLIEGLSDIDEFEVMKNCKHHIIANSTFSWWAAYLGENEGVTIAPVFDIWERDFYPENWITLKARG